jgi:hypothetical protein
MAQNPTRQVHALLGRHGLCKTRWLKTKTAANLILFYTKQTFEQLPNLKMLALT